MHLSSGEVASEAAGEDELISFGCSEALVMRWATTRSYRQALAITRSHCDS